MQRRHDHDGMAMGGMDVSSMSMGDGIPTIGYLAKMYWAVVGAFVALATLVNVINHAICRHRLWAARKGDAMPARPKLPLLAAYATATAIARELINASLPPIPVRKSLIRLPPLGRTAVVAANIAVLLVLCFYKLNPGDRWSFENIGYRTGLVCMTQIPLIFLLAGKNSVVGWLTGTSYERLSWLHRWTARCLLLTATIHMGYWFADWAPYGFIGEQVRTDRITRKGVIAWAILAWMVASAMAPVRGWSYELFVVHHLASFAVFFVFVHQHTPAAVHVYLWIPVGLFVFDRALRALRTVYTNLSAFHPKQRRAGQMSGFWACRAEFAPLPGGATRITIRNPPIGWRPGQHVFLSCHSIVPLQSHPFTVASIPADARMEFIVKAEKGGTRRFFRHAERLEALPRPKGEGVQLRAVAIEGPYGRLRPLWQFDSVVLLAGSTGATFTVPLMRDVCQRLGAARAVARRVRFVWVVKSGGQLSWFADRLSDAVADFEALKARGRDAELDISVYVTCDALFTEERTSLPQLSPPEADGTSLDEKSTLEASRADARPSSAAPAGPPAKGCRPDGSCCCRATVETEDAITAADVCDCSAPAGSEGSTSQSSAQTAPRRLRQERGFLHPRISVRSGRPECRSIIRRSLEQAFGESAVVVCGPTGLVEDVRRAVVRLSDERAVHKGTGAQGIYLHCESFSL